MISKFFGLCILIGSLASVYLFEGTAQFSGALRILHWPAIVLTGFGPIGLILMSSNFRLVWQTIVQSLGKSPEAKHKRHEREAVFLQKLGDSFYNHGIKAFDEVSVRGLSDYLQKVVERLSIRMPIPDIRNLLETERDRHYSRLVRAHALLGLGVRLAPSVGMLGTILGMVQLLSTLSDPSHLGPHISMALFTTFYGLFFSLAVWTPLQQRLERALDTELDCYNQVLRWLEFLEKRKPADYFADTAELSVVDGDREPIAA